MGEIVRVKSVNKVLCFHNNCKTSGIVSEARRFLPAGAGSWDGAPWRMSPLNKGAGDG